MKLIWAVVQADDAAGVMKALNERGHRVTRIATQGAWLRRENSTLLIGVPGDQVSIVLRVLRDTARKRTAYVNVPGEVMGMFNPQPLEVEVGGATVFVLDVERFERLQSEASHTVKTS
jgi:uncharacterized protein YaaQ